MKKLITLKVCLLAVLFFGLLENTFAQKIAVGGNGNEILDGVY